MDPKQFDTWTRKRALRLSRRNALRLAGAAGASATIAAHSLNTLAQTTCSLTLHGETAGGPSAPAIYDGALQFSLETDGTLGPASFTPAGGAPATATVSLAGRAIDIQITLDSGQILALSGTTDRSGPACPAAAAGILSGPQPGDLGGWQLTSGSGAPALTPGQGEDGTTIGATCASGQIVCGGACVAACPSGQSLDLGSCSCVPSQSNCQPDQRPCEVGAECCSEFCSNGVCSACPGLVCGDIGCVDNLTDPNNCGTCGTVCVDDTGFCLGGLCQCIPDNEPKGSSSSSCCSKTYVEPTGLCGCALLGEWCGSTGECCGNGSGERCVDDGSGFKTCCRQAGSGCSSDDECCFSSPSYSPQHACIAGVCAPRA